MNIFQKVARETQSQKAKNIDGPGFISKFLSGNPLWTDNDYTANALEGYGKNWIVYRCIRERSQAVSFLSKHIKVYKKAKKGEDEHLSDHPLQLLLEKPNPYYSTQTLLEFWEMSRCLDGKSFFQLARLDLNDIPEQMYYLLPNRMKVIPDKDKYISGYEYKLGSVTTKLMPEQILFFKMLDPLNPDFEGQSILEAGSRDIDISNKIQEWNKVFFDNAARPDGAFVTDGNLQDDSFDRIDNQIRQKYTGIKNAHLPLLLESGVKWEEIGKTHKDMDFPKLKTMSRQDICDLHAVPTALISNRKEDGATYNNRKEARKYFWEDTILPEGNDLLEQINNNLAVRYGDDIYTKIDTSNIPALKEDEDSRVDRINNKIEKNWITLNEARMSDGKEEMDGMDITLAEHQAKFNNRGQIQTSNKSITDMSAVKQLLVKVNQTLEDVKKNDKKLELFEEYKDLFTKEEQSTIKENLTVDDITLEHALKWFEYVKQLNPFEDEFNDLVTRLFEEQEQIVLGNLNDKKSIKTKDISESDIEDILFQSDEQQEYFFDESLPIFRNTVQVFGSEALQSVGMSIDFDLENPRVQDYLDGKVFQFSESVNNTTSEAIRKTLKEGLKAGESIPELAKRIEEVYKNAVGYRSTLIARTESTMASNGGTFLGYQDAGIVENKEWISALDERTRPAHLEANGQIQKLEEPFIVWNEELQHPGDYTNASVKNLANCRCTFAVASFTE